MAAGCPRRFTVPSNCGLLTRDGADAAVFDNLVFDQRFEPPDVQEEWSVPVAAAEVRHVMGLLRDSTVLQAVHAGQAPETVADRLTTELIVGLGDSRSLRKFGPTLPTYLSKLEEALQNLIAKAKEKSPKTLYHEGKKVG